MTTPTPELTGAVLALGFAEATQRLRETVAAAVEALWRALTQWRDPDISRFVAQVTPVVLGGQQQMSALTAAYLAQQRSATLGVPFRPAAVRPADVTGAAVRNGTPPNDVYRRAGIQVWRDLAEGRDLADAVRHGEFRAVQAAQTDLQLTKTHTSRAVFDADDEVTGYERVLSGPENCGLCVVASTQRYFKEDLLPIHPGCDCGVSPLYGEDGLDQVIHRERLEAAHDAIAERFGTADRGGRSIDYRKLLLVEEHGELGPVLTVARHHFTGPEAVRSGLDLTDLPGR